MVTNVTSEKKKKKVSDIANNKTKTEIKFSIFFLNFFCESPD